MQAEYPGSTIITIKVVGPSSLSFNLFPSSLLSSLLSSMTRSRSFLHQTWDCCAVVHILLSSDDFLSPVVSVYLIVIVDLCCICADVLVGYNEYVSSNELLMMLSFASKAHHHQNS